MFGKRPLLTIFFGEGEFKNEIGAPKQKYRAWGFLNCIDFFCYRTLKKPLFQVNKPKKYEHLYVTYTVSLSSSDITFNLKI